MRRFWVSSLAALFLCASVAFAFPPSSGRSSGGFSGGSRSSGGSSRSSGGFSGGSSSRSSGGFSGGSSRSGSGSSKPSSGFSGGSSKPSSGFSGGSSKPSSGPGFSGGSSKPSSGSGFLGGSKSSAPSSNSTKPTTGFTTGLTSQAQKADSKAAFQASQPKYVPQAPRSTYKTSSGKVVPMKADAPQVTTIRKYVTHERYVTYDNRASGFYGSYYSRPYYYNDSFSPFLMGWLLSDTLNSHQRALWMYHHQSDMDSARYAELIKKDAQLQIEIERLKAQNLARDPNYVPVQMKDNPDIMYTKDFVDAAVNPTLISGPPVSSMPPVVDKTGHGAGYYVLWTLFWICLVGGIVWFFFGFHLT